jgi:tetratricopeptide (TPR) repeat protein
MNKRLELLVKMVQAGTADSFAHYALALEYKKEQQYDDAIEAFTQLREKDPQYLPMYLMAGQLLGSLGRGADAQEWLRAGIELAKKQGNTKTLGELQSELAQAQQLSPSTS